MKYLFKISVCVFISLVSTWQVWRLDANELSVDQVHHLQPLAYWQFDDVSQVMLDETGRHIMLARGGVTRSPGKTPLSSGAAAAFNGRDGYFVVRHRDEFLLEHGTIAFWVRPEDVVRPQGLVSKDASGFGDGGHLTISLANGNVKLRLQSSSESYELQCAIDKQRWTHIACTFGGNGLQLFVNGQLVSTSEYQGGLGGNSGGTGNREPLVLGASTMTSLPASESPLTDYFQGLLDKVVVFARQLENDEVNLLAAVAAPHYDSLVRSYVANQPIAWWRLDEAPGTLTAVDQVGSQAGSYHDIGASRFDGDDYVDLGAFDLDESFTIIASVEPADFTVSEARIIAKENGLDEDDQFWSLSVTVRDDQPEIRFQMRTEHGTREAIAKARVLRIGEAAFLAVTYDGHSIRIYHDGELVASAEHRGHPQMNAHCHVWIGDTPAGAGERPFSGQIRDVAILRDSITDEQVKAIYQASLASVRVEPEATSPELPSPADSPESLPFPNVNGPAPIELPQAEVPPLAASPRPFVHRCPLCDVRYQEVPIHRVTLPGTPALPWCDSALPIGP
ncbi:MAG: LamG domain-containing protein [Planctomycetaceae bacterium]|nr:LamG domain-containing protein [Planctomycetales bacterium]MCB9926352.1 LamG domain-containing protein [Planctomycetaceae bacterium]